MTKVRSGRAVAAFARFQSALGTAATVFTGAHRLWDDGVGVPVGPRVNERFGMESAGPYAAAAYVLPDRPAGRISAKATPASLQALLASNFGPFAAEAWTLASQVTDARWLTLALLEDVLAGTYKVVRVRDAWIHRLTIAADERGMLMLDGEYAGRSVLQQAANAGGLTLPASPAQPTDKLVFPFDNVALYRDPDGANIQIRFAELRLVLDQGLRHEPSMTTGLYGVSKKGPLRARLEIETDWADESWAAVVEALAGGREAWRIVATTEAAPIQTFTADLHELAWTPSEDDGHDGKTYKRHRVSALARETTAGDFIDLTLESA